MNTENNQKILGQLIKEEVERQGISAAEFGEKICCERQNVYKIYKKASLDTAQLGLICRVLNHNFFADIADNQILSGVENEEAMKEIKDRMAVNQFLEVVPGILKRMKKDCQIFIGEPYDIPDGVFFPRYLLSPYNILPTVGKLLSETGYRDALPMVDIIRYEDEKTGFVFEYWRYAQEKFNIFNFAIDYRTEEEWEEILIFIFDRLNLIDISKITF